MDFYRGFVLGLGEELKYLKVDLFYQIQQGIKRLYTERGIITVLLLYEMSLSKGAFLQNLVILLNFQMDSMNPFVLILACLPHLQTRLRLNQHRPFNQRIIMRYQMEAIDERRS
ncbi:hypothetical protein PNH38_14745 [Anoxybacillus rupiensis]|jgi:general secretion pathway protein A|uniref:Uncharacterized protein n=1 Tax=Anoxybacteroides rupiense TaxID=311460 RepID=A0ABT5W706_9BACL|nr:MULTISPECIES: hypothetical protein [Anoxybacillus]MDE8565113.1 hypothetical protein [Anoxybacillus rupiensis]